MEIHNNDNTQNRLLLVCNVVEQHANLWHQAYGVNLPWIHFWSNFQFELMKIELISLSINCALSQYVRLYYTKSRWISEYLLSRRKPISMNKYPTEVDSFFVVVDIYVRCACCLYSRFFFHIVGYQMACTKSTSTRIMCSYEWVIAQTATWKMTINMCLWK